MNPSAPRLPSVRGCFSVLIPRQENELKRFFFNIIKLRNLLIWVVAVGVGFRLSLSSFKMLSISLSLKCLHEQDGLRWGDPLHRLHAMFGGLLPPVVTYLERSSVATNPWVWSGFCYFGSPTGPDAAPGSSLIKGAKV